MSLTPMMQQYKQIKQEHPDALLMFRLGDFYELFFEDALVASRVLEITLTGREGGSEGRIPMCGVPYHAVDQYLNKLIDKGFRVAICEQMEDPKATKGIVKREVVRIVTPGTSVRDDGPVNRYLCSVFSNSLQVALALVDVGTGEVYLAESSMREEICDLLETYRPAEMIFIEDQVEEYMQTWLRQFAETHVVTLTRVDVALAKHEISSAVLKRQYQVEEISSLGLSDIPLAIEALASALEYVEQTQKIVLPHLQLPQNLLTHHVLQLDATVIRNLELLETSRTRQRRGSLFGLLDHTKTAVGCRTLRGWIERPLLNKEDIEARLDVVTLLREDIFIRTKLIEALDKVYDLERLLARISFGHANARDLIAIAKSLQTVPLLQECLNEIEKGLLYQWIQSLPDVADLSQEILAYLVDDAPVSVRDGGFIRTGIDADLDRFRALYLDGKTWLADLESQERERTGIKNLKIGFNKVFGYYLEVSKANLSLVPEHYERRQTLTNGERYVLPELKQREADILNAEERAAEREFELFRALCERVLMYREELQLIAKRIGEIDAICSLSTVAAMNDYVRPEISQHPGVHIVGGRHPMVEAARPGSFVPNDVELSADSSLLLITGPNMGGKSTYMRQTALIVLMAHIGCFVPARQAKIGLVDRVFTRIGASDDLGAGQSTFMVEMTELAQILQFATERSLVILDEIGRGTSTYDGLSIAEAVVEALQQEDCRPLTLFATHYHELTTLADEFPAVKNYSVAVQEVDGQVVLLHTVIAEPADKSYGIQVARLAGIPDKVIVRAKEILALREQPFSHEAPSEQNRKLDTSANEVAATTTCTTTNTLPDYTRVPLWDQPIQEFLQTASEIDVMQMTPLEAMQVLHRLSKDAKELAKWVTFK